MGILQQQYKSEAQAELHQILQFWANHAVDNINGGFYGQINENNEVSSIAPKGSVLNSRILWTFSAAYNQTHHLEYLELAERAYDYLTAHFIDKKYGGLYWTVDYLGNPLDTKKQIYATAFAIYALSEYHKINKLKEAKIGAMQLFQDIEKHSFESKHTGYIDAFTRDWNEIHDMRLSEKDSNEKKTMNTHLHILEAYTNLYGIWQDNTLKEKIIFLIKDFTDHIINSLNHHLILFFDEYWNPKSTIISFGHDIEASWLLQEAAEAIKDKVIIDQIKQLSLQITDAVIDGVDEDGGLWNEKEGNSFMKEKHWWPQAEAMVGFLNAFQNSGNEKYFRLSYRSWQFIRQYIKSPDGEWYWGIKVDHTIMKGQDKAGLWKCPYHNSRACLEIMKRIKD
ncbi:MAG: N-acyl-D-glucosamine 2-epimerase [Chitinophagaceae bacterium]|nr:MAG: N-acyl-D-glucosamine 2-epimerase [Chitinophagaceae bacterium]